MRTPSPSQPACLPAATPRASCTTKIAAATWTRGWAAFRWKGTASRTTPSLACAKPRSTKPLSTSHRRARSSPSAFNTSDRSPVSGPDAQDDPAEDLASRQALVRFGGLGKREGRCDGDLEIGLLDRAVQRSPLGRLILGVV